MESGTIRSLGTVSYLNSVVTNLWLCLCIISQMKREIGRKMAIS